MSELQELVRKHFTEIQNTGVRQEIIEDLLGVGVTEPFFTNVHIPMSSSDAVSWITNRFRHSKPIIMFGSFGMGKTQIISQVARSLGYRIETLSTSTKLPEDFGGIPLTLEVDMSDEQYRGFIRQAIREEKLDAKIDEELEKLNRPLNSRKIFRENLKKKFENSITVTEDEVNAKLQSAPKKRLEQRMSAPQWVFDAMDAWATKRQKTVLFFDEINHADQKTLCTLFDLVQAKRFGNRSEYSFRDAVVFAAAGNFTRDNQFIEPLSQPLIDRFKFIIYYPGDWSASVQWVKDSYLDMGEQYPHLSKLLSDSSISDSVWQSLFPSPRSVEDFIEGLAEFELQAQEEGPDSLSDITSLDAVGLSQRNEGTTLGRAVLRFLAAIGVPKYSQEKSKFTSTASSTFNNFERTKRNIDKQWKRIATGAFVALSTDKQATNTPEGMQVFYEHVKQQLGTMFKRDVLQGITDTKGVTLYDAFNNLGFDLPR